MKKIVMSDRDVEQVPRRYARRIVIIAPGSVAGDQPATEAPVEADPLAAHRSAMETDGSCHSARRNIVRSTEGRKEIV